MFQNERKVSGLIGVESVRASKVTGNSVTHKTISAGLVIGFVVLVLLIAGVGWVGLRTMAQIHAQAREIADTQLKDVQLASEALNLSNQNSRINLEIAMSDDRGEIDSFLARQKMNNAQVSELLKQLQVRIGSKSEQKALDLVFSTRAAYTESYQVVMRIKLEEKDSERARRSLMQATLPPLLKYHAAWSAFVEFQTDEMNRQVAESSVKYAAARERTLILMALSAVLALCIVAGAIKTIVSESRRRASAEREVQGLNQELEGRVLERTAALEKSNSNLSSEIGDRKQIEAKLRLETAFFEALTNSALDGILVVDNDRKIVLRNRRFVEILNVPQQIADGNDDNAALESVLATVKDPDCFLSKVNYLYDHIDEISRDEIELEDGTVIDRYSSPVIDRDGNYHGRIWFFHDITERKRNEETLRSLSLAVEQSPVSIVITELSGTITYVNQKFVESTGYARQEVLGKNPRILKSGHTGPEDYRKLWDTLKAGNEWRGELQNRKKNGDLYWETALIRPIKDEKGATTHFLALKEDVTERRSLEIQLQQAQKLEAIGQLASGIAHEINTPTQYIGDNITFLAEAFGDLTKLITAYDRLLAAAKGNTLSGEVVQEVSSAVECANAGYLMEEIPKALAQSAEGVDRVSKIVGAMKEFSHPGAKEKTQTDLNRAIASTVTVSRNEWKYVADLETDFDASLPLIPCLPGEFNQVILNLIVNAAHAVGGVVGKGGSQKGRIRVQTLNCQDWAEVRIEDTGGGIPNRFRSRIFEPFFTTKEVGKGTGQGLAIARSVVVKKHKGSIHFETAEGKGTTFIIRLPKDGKSVPAVAQGANA